MLAYDRRVAAEAKLEQTDAGLVPRSPGWFVLNARDARWNEKPGQGFSLPLTGDDEYEAETFFPMLGMAIRVVNPGEPTTTYHWETEQEDFLVLAGEAVLIVEGQERRLKQRDFVHCPPETKHAFAGAGDGPCVRRPLQRQLAGGHAGWIDRVCALPGHASYPIPERLVTGLALRGWLDERPSE